MLELKRIPEGFYAFESNFLTFPMKSRARKGQRTCPAPPREEVAELEPAPGHGGTQADSVLSPVTSPRHLGSSDWLRVRNRLGGGFCTHRPGGQGLRQTHVWDSLAGAVRRVSPCISIPTCLWHPALPSSPLLTGFSENQTSASIGRRFRK